MSAQVPADWSFARRPFWLFSHVFAITVVVSFVALGFWQLNRHGERADVNAIVEERSGPSAEPLAEALTQPPEQLDYQAVTGRGSYLDGDFVRVANRSQGGVAGQYLVGLFQLDDGQVLLVNRGFVPLHDSVEVSEAATGTVEVEGWLRQSVAQGAFGAADTGDGTIVPRLDVAAIGQRTDQELAPVWLQLTDSDADAVPATFPDPVPLPPIDGGPHLSYMFQWFTFALLGVLFYGALLRRKARGGHEAAAQPTEDDHPATPAQL